MTPFRALMAQKVSAQKVSTAAVAGPPRGVAATMRWLAVVLVLSLAVTGCVDLEQLIRLNPDGSGELVMSFRFDPELLQEGIEEGEATSIEEMLAEMRENAASEADGQAEQLGEGVRFEGIEELAGEKPGLRMRFSFEDVAKLELAPMGPLGSGPGGASAGPSDEKISLGFEQGGSSSTLRVALFSEEELAELERELGKAASAPEPEATTGSGGLEEAVDEMAEMMMSMMKEMFQGLRVAMVVEPQGEILSTNASFRDGNRITLMRLDFSALLENAEAMERLGSQEEEPSLAMLAQLMGGSDTLQMELVPEVLVEFSGGR